MGHANAEMTHPGISLLGNSQITLWNQNVTHGEHSKTAKLFGSVENDWRESTWHFRVETHLDSRLNLVFALDQQIEKLLRVYHSLSIVGHQPDQSRVPLIAHLRKSGRPACHQNLPHPILESLHSLVVNANKSRSSYFFGVFILKFPDAIFLGEFVLTYATFRQNAHLKPRHVKEQVWIVF